jgi:hypothetical protein
MLIALFTRVVILAVSAGVGERDGERGMEREGWRERDGKRRRICVLEEGGKYS